MSRLGREVLSNFFNALRRIESRVNGRRQRRDASQRGDEVLEVIPNSLVLRSECRGFPHAEAFDRLEIIEHNGFAIPGGFDSFLRHQGTPGGSVTDRGTRPIREIHDDREIALRVRNRMRST